MQASFIQEQAAKARKATNTLGALSEEDRNRALRAMADYLETHRAAILEENRKDIEAAEKRVQAGELSAANARRLSLQGSKFDGMVEGLRSVATLPDPINQLQKATELDENLNLYRVSCPIGVIAVIFESRPDALPQIASLCLKSANALLLKGGSEAIHSNRALAKALDEAARSIPEIPEGWITLLETREDIAEILKLDQYIDLIIPRGSNAFVRYIMDNTNIPVTGHRDGICHTYIHGGADPEMALRVTVDGKTQYSAVCNATETLLVDRSVAEALLPSIACTLSEKDVALRCDKTARAILEQYAEKRREKPFGDEMAKTLLQHVADATEEDWKTEYLDLTLAIHVVENIDQAIEHINQYGSHHTDVIVTEDDRTAAHFMNLVDSACVFHNCSTRFADGFRFGLGAEVGISTEKIHSRGPVGLEGLTIYKYMLKGKGQIVADYGPGGRKFTHRDITAE